MSPFQGLICAHDNYCYSNATYPRLVGYSFLLFSSLFEVFKRNVLYTCYEDKLLTPYSNKFDQHRDERMESTAVAIDQLCFCFLAKKEYVTLPGFNMCSWQLLLQ